MRSAVRAVVDHLADELDAEPAAAMLRQDVDVGEVDVRDSVGRGPAEADLAAVAVEADDPLRLFTSRSTVSRERPSAQ